jgi:hypothetical protein
MHTRHTDMDAYLLHANPLLRADRFFHKGGCTPSDPRRKGIMEAS